MNTEMPDLSVIVISWNTSRLLDGCLQSVEAAVEGLKAEIIVVDNGSRDDSVPMVAQRHPAVHLLANRENRGFGPANNQGLRLAKGKYALLLNSDTEVSPEAVRSMIAFMESHTQAGLAGVEQYNQAGRLNLSNLTHRRPREFLEYLVESLLSIGQRRVRVIFNQPRRLPVVNSACWITRLADMRMVGMFDDHLFMYGEERDVCDRMEKAGREIWLLRGVQIIHYRHGGLGQYSLWNDLSMHLKGELFVTIKQLNLSPALKAYVEKNVRF